MPNLNDILAKDTEFRAADAWTRIQEKPTNIAFKTASGTVLPVQTVRLEYDSGVTQSEGAAGRGNRRKLTIFGVRGHAIVNDTNIKRGYRFVRESREYEVMSIIVQTGEIQAVAETVN